MNERRIALTTIALLTGLFLFLVTKPSGASPIITWSPQSLTPEIIAGSSATATISFSSSEKLTDASVIVSRELRGIVSVTPASIGTVQPGKVVSLTLTARPSATSTPASIQGSIYLYRNTPIKDIAYGLPLSVNMKVTWPTFTDPGHSYSAVYPPSLTATFDSSYNNLLLAPSSSVPDTESPGIAVSEVPNPQSLSVTEFFNGDHGSDLVGQSLGVFSTSSLPNGAIAYRFDPVVTMAGGVVVVIPGPEKFILVQDQNGGHSSDIDIILNSLTLY
jgi:hypothetical protein